MKDFPIVHIAHDDKFINTGYSIYEKAFPGKNRLLIFSNEDNPKLKYLSKDQSYTFINYQKDYLAAVSEKVKNAKYVVFHGLTYQNAYLAIHLKGNYQLVWKAFGYEIYNNPEIIGRKLCGKKTFRRFLKRIFWIKGWAAKILHVLIGRYDYYIRITKAIKEIDIVCTLYSEEYDFFWQLGVLKGGARPLYFNYYPLDVVIPEDIRVSGNNILLGNSASFSNNHLEAFDLLKKMDLRDRKIIAPLSYGRSDYANAITKEGSTIFGNQFKALTEFLPLREYQEIIQKCGIVIMHHYRQQAVGNVLNALYFGAKVYLSNKNTLLHYLKRIGCVVFCIEEDLIPENKKVFELLPDKDQRHNRAILNKELTLEADCTELRKKLIL